MCCVSQLHDNMTQHQQPGCALPYQVETAGDCYIVAGGLLSYDDDGFLAVDLSTSQALEASKHAANVFAFSKVCAWSLACICCQCVCLL